MIHIVEFAPEQFIDDGFTRVPGGAAFIYLFRRYGAPNYYSHKTVAGYWIKTSLRGVYIDFSIKAQTCWIAGIAAGEMDRKYSDELSSCLASVHIGGGYNQFCDQVHAAVNNCLEDQLYPVKVDDEYINILGVGKFEWDEKVEQMVGQVPYYELERK